MGENKHKKHIALYTLNETEVNNGLLTDFNPWRILKNNWWHVLILVGLVWAIYFNSLFNNFVMVDDLNSIVNNDKLFDFWTILKSFYLQGVLYSALVNLFGVVAWPFRLVSVGGHGLVVVLAYVALSGLFGKWKGFWASTLLAVHPINTEAVTWISGMPYVLNAIFAYEVVIFYLLYKQTGRQKYLWLSVGIFSLSLKMVMTPWVMVTPLTLAVVDQFLLNRKLEWRSLKAWSLFLVPMLVFTLVYVIGIQKRTIESRGNSVLVNQQTLRPVVESYPYTLAMMAKLYVYPKDLTIYYDGQATSDWFYYGMYVFMFVYGVLVWYLWKKDRVLTGLLILMPVLISPNFSPIKVAWWIAERYLYFGTGWFAMLMVLFLYRLGEKVNFKRLMPLLVSGMVVVFGGKTVMRNFDYKNGKVFALATIKAAPLSVRPYNDLGGAYFLENDYETALEKYNEALQVFPNSNTSVKNIGLIYMQIGMPEFGLNEVVESGEEVDKQVQHFLNIGQTALSQNDVRSALYYFGRVLQLKPSLTTAMDEAGRAFLKEGRIEQAKEIYKRSITVDSNRVTPWYALGFIEFEKGDKKLAKEYWEKSLELDPGHALAKEGLEELE